MNEVLRLTRVTLALHVALIGASGLLPIVILPGVPFAGAWLAGLPGLAVLVASYVHLPGVARAASSKGQRRFAVGLLVATLAATSLSGLISAVYNRNVLLPAAQLLGNLPSQVQALDREAGFSPTFQSMLFAFVPTLLGAWMSGRQGALRWAVTAIGLNAATAAVLAAVSALDVRPQLPPLAAQSFALILMAYFIGALADQLRAEHAEVERANRELAAQAHVREQLAASRERVRIARDLHDTMAHSLAAVIVQLDAIGLLVLDDDRGLGDELSRVRNAAQEGLRETRNAIGDLRASALDDLGLEGALAKTAQTMNGRGGTGVSYEPTDGINAATSRLQSEQAEALYRIAQEAAENALRHARASRIQIRLDHVADELILTIRDDGVGFSVEDVQSDRYGLRGMRERAAMIGATLRVNSNAGTEIEVRLNLGAK